ncbi:hypothetical protein KEM56_005836 [Ascosphaera pollenicola]|nr:hypothetical protein KEM56_005836 [Ascosphaera pollenicola]
MSPIIGNDGRVIDPSEHLPTDTWAPEPERRPPASAEHSSGAKQASNYTVRFQVGGGGGAAASSRPATRSSGRASVSPRPASRGDIVASAVATRRAAAAAPGWAQTHPGLDTRRSQPYLSRSGPSPAPYMGRHSPLPIAASPYHHPSRSVWFAAQRNDRLQR